MPFDLGDQMPIDPNLVSAAAPHVEPQAAQSLWLQIKDFLTPFLPPAITGYLGYAAAKHKITSDERLADQKQQNEDKKEIIAVDAAQSDSMTRRFEALMDGYETRIHDLTQEVQQLREEVKSLRKALDQRARGS
jgi:cell division protein FtsB